MTQIISVELVGFISPYPTVVIVVTAQYSAFMYRSYSEVSSIP